jgi:molecular chaperone HtpG
VLEVNPEHPLVRSMAGALGEGQTPPEVDELIRLLLDQARVVEGEPLPDPGAFSRRMSKLLQANLPPAA